LQYEIDVGGRTRHVTVTRAGAAFAISVDGHTWHVDAARIDGQSLSLILDSASSRDAVVTVDRATGQMTVSVDGVPVPVTVDGRRHARRLVTDRHVASGPHSVTAPMPGRVVRVLVKPGDAVAARQPVAVVEAMKMENELRALRDGTVAEVHVREGQSVDAGTLLVVIQ
jgi:biotin carboxyl carrier protein